MSDEEDIERFVNVTGASREAAAFYLESAGGEVKVEPRTDVCALIKSRSGIHGLNLSFETIFQHGRQYDSRITAFRHPKESRKTFVSITLQNYAIPPTENGRAT